MKNKIVLNILLILTSICGFSQQNNSIKYSQVLINNNSICLSQVNLVANLNLFNTSEIYLDELANEEAEIYMQNNSNSELPSRFYFKDNYLFNFNLTDNHYFLNNPNIKVGNNVSNVNLYYPLSFTNKYIQKNLGFIIIDLKMEDNSFSDEMIVINYNPITNIISSIHISSK